MTQISINYAKALCELNITQDVIEMTGNILSETPQLMEVITSPVVAMNKKHEILSRVFSDSQFGKNFVNFLKLLCDNHCFDLIFEIFEAYGQCMDEKNNIMQATLIYVTRPDDRQIEGIKNFLKKKEGAKDARIRFVQDDSLIGGFVLRYKDREYDWSLAGRIKGLRNNLVRR